ncbi:type II secretion system F family protein [Salmonella enterica]|nr:type II secretion system F family protein [Salmonella enterica]
MNIIIMCLFIAVGASLLINKSRTKIRRNNIKNKLSGVSTKTKANQEVTEPALVKIHRRTSKIITAMDYFEEQYFFKIFIIFLVNIIAFFIHHLGVFFFSIKTGFLFFAFSIIIVILVPARVRKIISAQKTKKINADLPYAIDIMAICVRSGMTIENSFIYISKNIGNINPDIAILFERTALKTEVSGISQALDQLYEEVQSTEIRMFCSTLQQSISFGSSIYPILVELSKDIREMQLISVEEKVASLSAKMSAPMILFIMFPILAIVAGPGFIRMLSIWSN